MPTPIRFRTDSIIAAEEARDRTAGKPPRDPKWVSDEQARSTPPAEPGDCWRIIYSYEGKPDSTAGYAICCPKCGEIHYWTTANNCGSKRKIEGGWIGRGPRRRRQILGWTCDHQQARTSCWTWTTDAEGKPLTARASLFVNHPDGCGYHGWLGGGGAPPGVLSDG